MIVSEYESIGNNHFLFCGQCAIIYVDCNLLMLCALENKRCLTVIIGNIQYKEGKNKNER